MTPEQKLERRAAISEELAVLKRTPAQAAAMLDRELEKLIVFHTERCCDLKLSPEQSAMHKEARALARSLIGFFERRRTQLQDEFTKLRTS
jgi:hypothetical protein